MSLVHPKVPRPDIDSVEPRYDVSPTDMGLKKKKTFPYYLFDVIVFSSVSFYSVALATKSAALTKLQLGGYYTSPQGNLSDPMS